MSTLGNDLDAVWRLVHQPYSGGALTFAAPGDDGCIAVLESLAEPRARLTPSLRPEPVKQYGIESELTLHLNTPEPIRGGERSFGLG